MRGILHEDQCTFLIICCSFLRMRSISDKSGREIRNTHFIFSNFFFNRCVYEITLKDVVQPGRPQVTIWRMRTACWITKARNAHPKYVLLIALPLQQQLHEHASTLRCTYIACLVIYDLTGLQSLEWKVYIRCSLRKLHWQQKLPRTAGWKRL